MNKSDQILRKCYQFLKTETKTLSFANRKSAFFIELLKEFPEIQLNSILSLFGKAKKMVLDEINKK